jgi:glutaconate CoA-transferase, subunit B
VRLPGAGGAPEISAFCKETFVMLRQTPRTFVDRLDFRTTVGFGDGAGSRERLGFSGAGVTAVVTDLGILEPDPGTSELTLTTLHPGVDADSVRSATGWDLHVADEVVTAEPPTGDELRGLRALRSAADKASGE